MEVVQLYNADATKANILAALNGFAGQMTKAATKPLASLNRIKPAQPEDALIIYYAGHGTADKDRFYLLPHDLGYQGDPANLTKKSLVQILAHGISDREIETAVEKIDAGRLVLVIDACNSGQALDAEEKRRGPMNAKGLAQLAYEKGMYILTAAQSYQVAMECEINNQICAPTSASTAQRFSSSNGNQRGFSWKNTEVAGKLCTYKYATDAMRLKCLLPNETCYCRMK